MNIHKTSLVVVVVVCIFIFSTNAYALYSIGGFKNNYDTEVTINLPVPAGMSPKLVFGDFTITIPEQGVASFTDIGSWKPVDCVAPTWGVIVTYQGDSWGFYYEGGGKIGITINADGSLSLNPIQGVIFDSGPCAHID